MSQPLDRRSHNKQTARRRGACVCVSRTEGRGEGVEDGKMFKLGEDIRFVTVGIGIVREQVSSVTTCLVLSTIDKGHRQMRVLGTMYNVIYISTNNHHHHRPRQGDLHFRHYHPNRYKMRAIDYSTNPPSHSISLVSSLRNVSIRLHIVHIYLPDASLRDHGHFCPAGLSCIMHSSGFYRVKDHKPSSPLVQPTITNTSQGATRSNRKYSAP